MKSNWRKNQKGKRLLEEVYDTICFAHEEMLEISNSGNITTELSLFIDKKDEEIFFNLCNAHANSKEIIFLEKIIYQQSSHFAKKNKVRRKFVHQYFMKNVAILRKVKLDLLLDNNTTTNYPDLIKKLRQKKPLDTVWFNGILKKLSLVKEYEDFYKQEAISIYFRIIEHQIDKGSEMVMDLIWDKKLVSFN
jgi:hypothetical protein